MRLAALVLVAAVAAAYSNGLTGEFLFDDDADIVRNPTVRQLWPPWRPLIVGSDGAAALHNRPVVNLSFALNYAVGGLDPFGYHATNVVIHVLAGLALFGIMRRTLLLPRLGLFAPAATPLALTVALIWSLHPLQTQAVTYIVQRYESLMGLFYLLTLYTAIRGVTAQHARLWQAASIACFVLALGSKEVAVSAPLVVLLYDRAFVTGSFAEAWRRRRGLYLAFVACWAAYAVAYQFTAPKPWAGQALHVSSLEYAGSQPGVILHYLGLCFWPRGQCLDYAWPVARTAMQMAPPALGLGVLLAATVWALVYRPGWGLLGAWFFLILAPTSSVMALADLAMEHRMYLPLAAVVSAVVLGIYVTANTSPKRKRGTSRQSPALAPLPQPSLALRASVNPRAGQGQRGIHVLSITAAVVVLALGAATHARNRVYDSEAAAWTDVAARAPHNGRAWTNLCSALCKEQRFAEACQCGRHAVALLPRVANAWLNLGAALAQTGKLEEAQGCFERALAIEHASAKAHSNLAAVLAQLGHSDRAYHHLNAALRIDPDYWEARANLARLMRSQPSGPTSVGSVGSVRSDPNSHESGYPCDRLSPKEGQDSLGARRLD